MAEVTVATPTSAVEEMRSRRALPSALNGGTARMRGEGETWLPREPGESMESYKARLNRSFLFNAYGDTIGAIASRPFAKPVVVKDDAPERIVEMLGNVDQQGTNLTRFANRCLEDAVNDGIVYVLVDYPQIHVDLSRAQESTIRPWLIEIPADDIVGWRSETVEGVEILTQLRIASRTCEQVGLFGEMEVERIRVFDRRIAGTENPDDPGITTLTIWRKNPDEQDAAKKWFIEHAPAEITLNEIPLRVFYTNQTGFMSGTPPLEDLAWKNLEHWQSASDQRNILRFARVPVMFAAGFTEDDVNAMLGRIPDDVPISPAQVSTKKRVTGRAFQFGAQRMIFATAPEAKLSWIEAQGKAIADGRTDLRDIEEQMALLGMRPLLQRPGDQTATEAAIDESQTQSDVKAWIRGLENLLEESFQLAARWLAIDDAKIVVDVNDDFQIGFAGAKDIESLVGLRVSGDLSGETLLSEYKRRGILAPGVDVVEELARAQTEGFGIGDE